MNPIIVMGVSGCGKSSVGERLAAHFCLTYVEGDALHPAANVAKMAAGTPLTDEDRWPWLDRIGAEMASHMQEGKPIVVSCSALKRIYRDHLRRAVGGRLDFVFLEGSLEVLRARMAARKGHFMPVSLLESQLNTLEPPTGEPGVVTVHIDGSKEDTVMAAITAMEDHHHMQGKAV